MPGRSLANWSSFKLVELPDGSFMYRDVVVVTCVSDYVDPPCSLSCSRSVKKEISVLRPEAMLGRVRPRDVGDKTVSSAQASPVIARDGDWGVVGPFRG